MTQYLKKQFVTYNKRRKKKSVRTVHPAFFVVEQRANARI